MRKSVIAALVAMVGAAVVSTPSAAQQRTELGMLDCVIQGVADIAIVTSREVSCTFVPTDNTRPPENYVGQIRKFGLEVGATSESVMQWLVLAPTATDPYAPGSLSDNYVGASAEVTPGIGGGINVLVSESGKNLVLQPVSLQAQTGLNLALGVTAFQLRSTAI